MILELFFLRISMKPELKIDNPAATGISLELTWDIPTHIGRAEIIPKYKKELFQDSKVR